MDIVVIEEVAEVVKEEGMEDRKSFKREDVSDVDTEVTLGEIAQKETTAEEAHQEEEESDVAGIETITDDMQTLAAVPHVHMIVVRTISDQQLPEGTIPIHQRGKDLAHLLQTVEHSETEAEAAAQTDSQLVMPCDW